MGTSWGRTEYEHAEIDILFLKPCGDSLARSLRRRGHTSRLVFLNPKFPFFIPGTAIELSAKQLLLPT